jgi:hypothetical protein
VSAPGRKTWFAGEEAVTSQTQLALGLLNQFCTRIVQERGKGLHRLYGLIRRIKAAEAEEAYRQMELESGLRKPDDDCTEVPF